MGQDLTPGCLLAGCLRHKPQGKFCRLQIFEFYHGSLQGVSCPHLIKMPFCSTSTDLTAPPFSLKFTLSQPSSISDQMWNVFVNETCPEQPGFLPKHLQSGIRTPQHPARLATSLASSSAWPTMGPKTHQMITTNGLHVCKQTERAFCSESCILLRTWK